MEHSYSTTLTQAGLSANQAQIYEILLKYGTQPASKIALKSTLSRPLTYKVLDELVALGLAEKHDDLGAIARFSPAHPLKLKDVVERRFESATSAKIALDSILGSLVGQFNTITGQPGVRILEGLRGIEELYEDILNEQHPLLLMRSYLDDTQPELASLVEKQLHSQARLHITTRALTPPESVPYLQWKAQDEKNLVERRIIPESQFHIPAQIIIYAGKVAMTAYSPLLITTIIDNPAIHATFTTLFERLWTTAPAE